MSTPAHFGLHSSAQGQKAQPYLRPIFRLAAMFTALVVVTIGALPLVLGVATTCFTVWLGTSMVTSEYHSLGEGWKMILTLDVAKMMILAAFSVFFWRQLLGKKKPSHSWIEVTAAEQPQLFEAVNLIANLTRTVAPTRLQFDSSSTIRADYPSYTASMLKRGLRLRIGLSIPVGVSTPQLMGLIAHELAFFSSGTGGGWNRITRNVVEWLKRRDGNDDWTLNLWHQARKGRMEARLPCLVLAGISFTVSLVLKFVSKLCEEIASDVSRRSVELADLCATRVMGSSIFARAIESKALLTSVSQKVEDDLRGNGKTVRLPDSLPQLVYRILHSNWEKPAPLENAHWVASALSTQDRAKRVRKMNYPGMINAGGSGTDIFRSFHELGRRTTYFCYQNDWGLEVTQHRFVSVEEILNDRRASLDTVAAVNRYLNGMGHPQRCFCGIADDSHSQQETEVLVNQLAECRDWLKAHQERMNTALNEWTSAWTLVRDLEMGLQLALSNMTVPMHQFSIGGSGPEAFQAEIKHQRHVMDAFEMVLGQYESNVETRMSCALELLWRENMEALPSKLREMRNVLPNWVLVYEALGLHLPVLRELMTHFHAMQVLGASVAGVVDSTSYVQTLQAAVPRVATLAGELLTSLQAWPYPFQTDDGSRVKSLSDYMTSEVSLERLAILKYASEATDQPSAKAQAQADELAQIITPFMDRYLNLYHQSFAWVTKSADLAEWHFCPPPDPLALNKPDNKLASARGASPLAGRTQFDIEYATGSMLSA
jgi:hypothetical protein